MVIKGVFMGRKRSHIAAAAVVALSLSVWAGGESNQAYAKGDSYTIKFGNVISPNDTQNQGYALFTELVEKRSDGRITVQVYPDSQLGGEREMIEATQFGDIAMRSEEHTYELQALMRTSYADL